MELPCHGVEKQALGEYGQNPYEFLGLLINIERSESDTVHGVHTIINSLGMHIDY